MREPKKILTLFLAAFFLITFCLDGQEKNTDSSENSKKLSLDIILGATASFNQAKVTVGSGKNETENTLNYSYFGIQAELDLMEYLTVGIMAGLNSSYLKDPVNFLEMPLSLRFDQEKNSSMVLGLKARSEFYLSGDFSLQARGQYLMVKEYTKNMDIDLAAVSGTAVYKNGFSQLTLELLAQYDGFNTFTLFAGPQINLISGELEASETIEQLSGSQKLDYAQKNPLGLVAGVSYEFSSNLLLEAWVNMVSKTSVTATLYYTF